MKLPQLSLRDLFWLVLVAAMAMGWWVDHRAASVVLKENASLMSENESLRQSQKNLADAIGREGYGVVGLDDGTHYVWKESD